MRLVLAFSLFGLLASCSGDSSSVMSSWDDETGGALGGGAGGSMGGRGGSAAGGQGGLAGQGGSGGVATTTIPTGGAAGNITVPGGARDAVTAQCISTSSGGGCPIDSTSLQCWKGPCGAAVSACFKGTSGPCADYAACLFNCPCNAGRSNCEFACLSDKGTGDEKCTPFLNDLGVCLSANSCVKMACLVN
jgi:hypothetical protein